MIKIKHRVLLFVLFFLNASNAVSLSPPGKHAGSGNRIHFGPVIGFYSINQKHARQPIAKFSVLAGFNREVRLDRDYHAFFSFGVDYFFHGLSFKSYYFKPDTIQLYDKSFAYDYTLRIHELNVPFQVKYLLRRADNSLFSPYITAAYHLRYLITSNLKISENGEVVKTDSPTLKFRTPLLTDKLNAFVSAGIGWQKNSVSTSSGSFFVELNFRYAFSSFYFDTNYSPSSLYINSVNLNLLLGLKF